MNFTFYYAIQYFFRIFTWHKSSDAVVTAFDVSRIWWCLQRIEERDIAWTLILRENIYVYVKPCCHGAFTFSISWTCASNREIISMSIFQPRLADCGSRRSAIHCADADIEYYRLRSFSITSHGICNLGDSMRWDCFHPSSILYFYFFISK